MSCGRCREMGESARLAAPAMIACCLHSRSTHMPEPMSPSGPRIPSRDGAAAGADPEMRGNNPLD
jgi:hypothetical protein